VCRSARPCLRLSHGAFHVHRPNARSRRYRVVLPRHPRLEKSFPRDCGMIAFVAQPIPCRSFPASGCQRSLQRVHEGPHPYAFQGSERPQWPLGVSILLAVGRGKWFPRTPIHIAQGNLIAHRSAVVFHEIISGWCAKGMIGGEERGPLSESPPGWAWPPSIGRLSACRQAFEQSSPLSRRFRPSVERTSAGMDRVVGEGRDGRGGGRRLVRRREVGREEGCGKLEGGRIFAPLRRPS
jgi:hypothetical protein